MWRVYVRDELDLLVRVYVLDLALIFTLRLNVVQLRPASITHNRPSRIKRTKVRVGFWALIERDAQRN